MNVAKTMVNVSSTGRAGRFGSWRAVKGRGLGARVTGRVPGSRLRGTATRGSNGRTDDRQHGSATRERPISQHSTVESPSGAQVRAEHSPSPRSRQPEPSQAFNANPKGKFSDLFLFSIPDKFHILNPMPIIPRGERSTGTALELQSMIPTFLTASRP